MNTLLQTLYGFRAWANVDLFNKLESVDREKHGTELQTALRLTSHYYVVSRIFASHLQGVPHGCGNFVRFERLRRWIKHVGSY